MDRFLFNFYNIIDGITNYICETNIIRKNLNYCNYNSNNSENNNIDKEQINKPIIFCLGGMAYKIYEKIFQNQNMNIKLDSNTLDYDFSLSLKNNDDKTIEIIETSIKYIFNQLIKDYSYTFDQNTINKYKLKFKTITKNNFKFSSENKYDRLHIKIECDIMKNNPNFDLVIINDSYQDSLHKKRFGFCNLTYHNMKKIQNNYFYQTAYNLFKFF
jgi:hypothetical protein